MNDMTTTPNHQGAPPVAGDIDSFPSHGSLARSLVEPAGHGTLSTLTTAGEPYGSLVAFATAEEGTPYLLASTLAEHTRNARRDPRASLFVTTDDLPEDVDRLAHPRVTLIGALVAATVSAPEREHYLGRHTGARRYVDFPDFGWWRLTVHRVRYVGGFGVMSWIDAPAYAAAVPDPVIGHAHRILAHMNTDHADACLLYARHLAGVAATSATAVGVDRYGFTLWAETADGPQVARVAFDRPAQTAHDVRSAAVRLVELARRRERAGES